MPNRLTSGEGADDDLDQTDELAVLDVAAYEARTVDAGAAHFLGRRAVSSVAPTVGR